MGRNFAFQDKEVGLILKQAETHIWCVGWLRGVGGGLLLSRMI